MTLTRSGSGAVKEARAFSWPSCDQSTRLPDQQGGLQQSLAMGRTLGMHLASRLAEVGVKVRAATDNKIRQAESLSPQHTALSSNAFGNSSVHAALQDWFTVPGEPCSLLPGFGCGGIKMTLVWLGLMAGLA